MSKAFHQEDVSVFGFWVYLMTDVVLFATLFAVYAVLRHNSFGGPTGRELFTMPTVLLETLILLTSSFTVGLAILSAHRKSKAQTVFWMVITFILGLCFLGIELTEFAKLVHEGNGPSRSAFLSSFFTLVGTHGAHITAGSIAAVVLTARVWKQGFSDITIRRLTNFSLFWHFLDIVWIFIFSVVYLMGVIK